MSGICGIISFDKDGVDQRTLISAMADSMRVGSEGPKTLFGNAAALDCSFAAVKGDYFSDENVSIAMTGEIYNLVSRSPASEMAKLYLLYKEDFLKYAEGQFNLCLWDKVGNKAIIATDRFGTSALNYYYDGKRFIFASKIRAIEKVIKSGLEINKEAIFNYSVFSFIPTPQTIYKNIKKIQPGSFIILDKNDIKVSQYWDVEYGEGKHRSEASYEEEIRAALNEAVRIRMLPGKNMGAFLSGGLDSSAVCGIMKRLSGNEVKTFSSVFFEEKYSEIEYINIAARHFGLKTYKYYIKPEDVIDAIRVLIKEYDEPFGNSSAVAAYYCMKLAKETGVDVMLAGDGGDENFAGYERYVTDKIFSLYYCLPAILRKRLIEPCANNRFLQRMHLTKKIVNYISHANIRNPERFFFYSLYPFYNRFEFFNEDFLREIDTNSPLNIINNYFDVPKIQSSLNRLMYLDTKLALIDNDLRGKIDKIGQILGVTVRYPMLDTKLWAVSGAIPAGLKLKGFMKKYIYKKAFRGFLPGEIINKKKHGFGLPFAVWLREDKSIRGFLRDLLLGSALNKRGYFKKGIFEKLLSMHDNDTTQYYGDMLWVFLMLELWHREWVDK